MVTASESLAASSDRTSSQDRTLDRWFYFCIPVFFLITVLLGFVPTSIETVNAAAAGQRPPLPPALHAHAALMGSWIVLLSVQSFLVATGRTHWHRRLGLVSFALVPAMVLAMLLVTRSIWLAVAALPADVLPPAALAAAKAQLSNVLFEQLKVVLLFPLFVGWAIAVRRTDVEMHKRLMILATLMPISAAIDRIAARWLPTNFPAGYEAEYGYLLLWLMPVLVYDVWRRGRVHRAYVIGIACNVPFFVANHFLWNSPRWLEAAPAIMSVVGVAGW